MILVVDDNQDNIFSLKALLDIHKYQVDTASSGEEALKKILKNDYALIILDVQMPEMDGFEVAEAISGYSKSKDIPIIFLSAVNTHKKFITKGYSSGGIDYVVKPFDPDILLLKIKTFYRLSEQTRQLNEMDKFLRAEIEFRKKAEQKLQEHVEELKSILESIPQITFTIGEDGQIEFVNKIWYQYSNHKNTFPETEGLPVAQYLMQALASRQQMIQEVKIKKLALDEFRFHVLYLTPIIQHTHVLRWVGIFTDIHEQKMSAQILEKKVDERTAALRKMNQQLEESNHELGQFAFIASHDLQEPLRKIQTFSHLLLDKYIHDKAKVTSYLHKIFSSAERLRKLITDLLSYASIKSSDLFQCTDMNVLVQEALMDLELKIKARNAVVQVGELPELEVIPSQMSQVFFNLVGNAIKFSRDDAPCVIKIDAERIVERSIEAGPSACGDFCRIIVKDNGIGFNEEFAGRIFEIFQRLNGNGSYEGTGIGLAIAKKVIERHNGIIAARSEENKGSSFIIVLPVRQMEIHQPQLS